MKAWQVGDRVGGVVEAHLAGGLRAAGLAPDLVALLLAEGAQEVVDRRLGRQRDDGADVLLLDVHRPAAVALASPERAREGVGCRVTAAETAQVDGVPRVRMARVAAVGEVVGERVGDGAEVVGCREERRVVGVVAGAEEHGLGVRRDGGDRGAVLVADRRPQLDVAGLHLVPVHQRDDAHRAGVRPGVRRDDDDRLLVRVRAVRIPPRAMDAPARERGRPGVRIHEAVPVGLLDGIEGATHRTQCGQGHRRGRPADGRRTGGLAVQRGWGHAREHSTGGPIRLRAQQVLESARAARPARIPTSAAPAGRPTRAAARPGPRGGGGGSTRAAAGRR